MPENRMATFLITNNLYSSNYSYCSKLVFQAYYYGTGSANVVYHISNGVVLSPYTLVSDGSNKVFVPKYGLHISHSY